MNSEELLNIYDSICNSCVTNVHNCYDKSGIYLKDFDSDKVEHKFMVAIANLVRTCAAYRVKIYLDMPFFKYLKFRVKNPKLKVSWKRKYPDYTINFEDMMRFVSDAHKVDYSIYQDIYDVYWKGVVR